MEKIGLQLYSIKELTEKDFLGTLKQVAGIGYTGVEFAGYFGTPAKELKKALADFGLDPAGSHLGIHQLMDQLESCIEYSKELGDPFIVCPGLPKDMFSSADACLRTAQIFNRIGEKCREAGLQFYYHNHDFEFLKHNGQYILDIFVDNTEPDNLHVELDTYWVEYAGLRSVDFMKKYGQRCSILHIKDMKSWTDKRNTEIGKGVMDFVEITALGKELGAKWYTIEQEEFEGDQLAAVAEGYRYLKGIL